MDWPAIRCHTLDYSQPTVSYRRFIGVSTNTSDEDLVGKSLLTPYKLIRASNQMIFWIKNQ